ncbi:MAG: DUF6713 family protein [Pseudomonadota bacterium]
MIDSVYFLLIGTFFTHELDAVKRKEWRILPIFKQLPENISALLFIWIHIPLFTVVLWVEHLAIADNFRTGVAIFAVIHVGLHGLLHHHPANAFKNLSSWLLILLTGFLGAIYLVLRFFDCIDCINSTLLG